MSTHGSRAVHSLSPWLLLCFAPLWDNLWAGQVNTWVLLALVMALVAEQRAHERAAGLWLSVAIVLKASPALLLLWFVARARWRALAWAILGVLLWSAAAAAVWGADLLLWYAEAVRATLGAEFPFSNLGVRAFLDRIAGTGAGGVLHLLAFAAAVAASLRCADVFARLVIVMTMFSPIVWYHHLVYLVIPIVAVLRTRPLAAWFAVACVQIERPVADRVSELTAVPVLLAAFVLFLATGAVRAAAPPAP